MWPGPGAVRKGLTLERLCKKYGAERVDALCKGALAYDVTDVMRIEGMLKSATQVEEKAEREGKLRQLPLPLGRFARPAHAFKTRNTEGT